MAHIKWCQLAPKTLDLFADNAFLAFLFGFRKQVSPLKPEHYLTLPPTLLKDKRALVGLHSTLMSQYLHQNELHWGKTQFAAVIQVAGIAGGYAASGGPGTCVLILTFFLTRTILAISIRDRECRDANLYWHIQLERAILSDDDDPKLTGSNNKGVDMPTNLRLGVPPCGL